MSLYSGALQLAFPFTNACSWGILCPGNSESAIKEITIVTDNSNGVTWGIGRSGNTPALLNNGFALISEDEARPTFSLSRHGTLFSTAPTIPTNYFRRFGFPAQVGIGITYTFPRGLVLAAGGSAIVLWTISGNTNTVTTLSCVIEE